MDKMNSITFPDGSTYEIADAEARQKVSELLVEVETLQEENAKLNSDITPKIENYGSKVGGKNGGIVFDSQATGFSTSTSAVISLAHKPINAYSIVTSIVSITSTNVSIKYTEYDEPTNTLKIVLTDYCGPIRLCICYPTLDDLSA